jgi:hypothetical protein
VTSIVQATPCASCGTTGGYVDRGDHRPRRTSGARFGIEGSLCGRCYSGLRDEALRRFGPRVIYVDYRNLLRAADARLVVLTPAFSPSELHPSVPTRVLLRRVGRVFSRRTNP